MKAEEWDARYADGPIWSATPNQFVAAELAGLPPGRALDLAAGSGRNAVWLASLGWTVLAVDFSGVAVGQTLAAAASAGVSLTADRRDLTAWVPPAGSYDLVLIAYLHLPADARRRVLRGAAAALAAGGTLLVVGHDRTNLTAGYGGPREPAILLDADELVADLAGTPVRVGRAGRVRRSVVAPDGSPRSAVDTLLRASRPAAP